MKERKPYELMTEEEKLADARRLAHNAYARKYYREHREQVRQYQGTWYLRYCEKNRLMQEAEEQERMKDAKKAGLLRDVLQGIDGKNGK